MGSAGGGQDRRHRAGRVGGRSAAQTIAVHALGRRLTAAKPKVWRSRDSNSASMAARRWRRAKHTARNGRSRGAGRFYSSCFAFQSAAQQQNVRYRPDHLPYLVRQQKGYVVPVACATFSSCERACAWEACPPSGLMELGGSLFGPLAPCCRRRALGRRSVRRDRSMGGKAADDRKNGVIPGVCW